MELSKCVKTASRLHGSYIIQHASGVKFHCDGYDISWCLPDCFLHPDDYPLEVIEDYYVEVSRFDEGSCKIYVQEPAHVQGVLQLIERSTRSFTQPNLVINPGSVEKILNLIQTGCIYGFSGT